MVRILVAKTNPRYPSLKMADRYLLQRMHAWYHHLFRVAMTKAAVKNMLRLMEAEPAGSPELDQYAHFVVQQDEIVLEDRSLDGARPTRGSESGGRDAASNGAETTREVDYADPSTCASTTGLPTPPLVRYGAHGDDTGQYPIEAGTSHVNMLSTVVSDGRQVNLHNGSGSVPRVDHDGGDVGLDVADGGKRDRSSHSHGDTGATAHPLPGSDWRRRTSESTPVERAAGLDAIELNVAGRDVAGVNKDSAREVFSEESGVMASPIATGASVVPVVGNDSMRLGQEMTISKPLVDMPPRENCAQAGERDHRGSDIAQARINECAATLHPGPGQTDVQPPLENFSVDPTHRPAATMVTIGVVAIGHKGDEETDVKGVRPASGGICRQREEHTPDNMDAPAASGVSSEVLSNVHLAAITTTAESTLAAADSSAMKPCETRLSQPPPLPPATATTVPIAAMIDPGTGPNTLAAPENLSIESRAQVSRRAQEMSATDPRDPAAGSRASTDGGISHPPAAAAGDATDVAAVRESPSAIVAVRKSSTSEEDRLENQCPVLCNNNIESATEATLLEPSAHLSIRERLLRRGRASADNSGIPATTSDSDPDRTNDCEKDDSDRLEDDGQDTSVHATATEEKGEEKPVDQSAKYVAGQGNEGGDTVDSVAADDDDQLSSNNDIDISHCQQSAGNINEEADSAVCQPAEEAIARPEAVDSTTTGPDGDDGKTGKAGSRTVAPEASQDLRSLDVQSHRTGDGEGVPNICADGAAEDPPSSVAVREQTSSKREEAGLDQTNKPDVVGNPLYDVRLYDPTRLEGGISGVPVVGIEGAFPVKTTVEDTGARAGSDSATEKGDGGDGENEVGEGSVAEKESASPQPDLVRARDGDGGRRDDSHDDGSPADSVANSSRESRAKMNAPRSGEGETTGDDAKVGVIIEAAGGGGEVLSADAKSVRDEKAAELVDIEPEWIEGYDPSHDCYYYHHVATGESSWFKPDAPYEPYVHSDEDEDDGVEEDVAVLEGNEEEREGARKEREGRNGAKPSSRRTSKGDPGHRSPDRGDESKKGKYASTGKKQKRQNGHDSKSRRGSEDHHERRKGGRSTNGTSSGKKRSSSPTAGASRTRSSPGIVHEPYASENSRSNSESRSVSRSSDDLDSRRFGKTGGRSGNVKTTDNRREADRERRSSRSNKSAARNEESKASDTRRGGGERDGDGDLDTGRRRRRRKTGSGVQKKSALDRLNDLTDENVRTSDSSSASDFDVRVGRDTRRDGKHRRDAEDKRRHDYSEALPGSGSPSRHHRRSRSPGSGGVAVRGHGTTLRDEGAEPSSSRRRSDFFSSSSRRYSSPSGGRRRDQDRRASFSAGNNVVGGSSSRREKERSSRRGSRSGDRDN